MSAQRSLQRPAACGGCRFEVGRTSAKFQPAPPKTGKPHAPAPRHRLRSGNLKGIVARESLHELIHGSDPKLGRWSHHKGLFTELLEATQGSSIAELISILSQADTYGAQNWPECGRARDRLKVLEGIRLEMEAAMEWVGIEDIEHLMCRAFAAGIIPEQSDRQGGDLLGPLTATQPEFQKLALTLAKRCCRLRSLREDLRSCAKSADIERVLATVNVAKELGAQWQELELAEVRLQVLQNCLAEMTDVLGQARSSDEGGLQSRIHDVLENVQEHIGEDPSPPLGWVLKALRLQYGQMRLEDVTGRRARLTREILAAERGANLQHLRAAVAEADFQFCLDASGVPGCVVPWPELELGKRRLVQFVDMQAELELLVMSRPIAPSPTAIIAALARADVLGCYSWTLCQEASARLQQVQGLEASVLRAVQDGSENVLQQACTTVQAAGFASWPMVRGAMLLLGREDLCTRQNFTSSTFMQRLLAELAEAEHVGDSAAEVPDVEEAFIGISLETECVDMAGQMSQSNSFPPLTMLVDMFQKITGKHPDHAWVARVRSGLFVFEVRLTGALGSFSEAVSHLETSQALDFGDKVTAARHLYSFVKRLKDQDQLALLKQIQRASSPGGESSVVSQQASTVDASIAKDVIQRELDLLREFATPSVASAHFVKTLSDPGSLAEEAAIDTTELLMEEVLQPDLKTKSVQSIPRKSEDDHISVVSEATDVESAQVLKMIQDHVSQFQQPHDMSGHSLLEYAQVEEPERADSWATVSHLVDDFISVQLRRVEECVAKDACENAFQTLETDEGIGHTSDVSGPSDIGSDFARDVVQQVKMQLEPL